MIYLDSCAIIKLVVPEAESVVLSDYLDAATEPLATSELSTVEVYRQLIRIAADEQAHTVADAVLSGFVPLALAPVIITAVTFTTIIEQNVASAVLFLASPGSSHVLGEQLTVDGGWTRL